MRDYECYFCCFFFVWQNKVGAGIFVTLQCIFLTKLYGIFLFLIFFFFVSFVIKKLFCTGCKFNLESNEKTEKKNFIKTDNFVKIA